MWSTVELRDLRVFLAVAEELHFGRAAEQLEIDRSRVSQIVHGLEAKLGARVFERTSRRVRLTPVGERLQASIAPICQEMQEALRDAREAATGVLGTLRLGMYMPTNGGRHMAEIIHTYQARHPGANVDIVATGLDRHDLEVMRAAEVDMIATRLPISTPDVTVGPILSREGRVLLVSKRDPLAERESVCLEDLADRLVTDSPRFRREMMDAFIPPVTPSGRRLQRTVTRSTEDLLMRIATGKLVHPTVPTLLAYYGHPEITSVPIDGLHRRKPHSPG